MFNTAPTCPTVLICVNIHFLLKSCGLNLVLKIKFDQMLPLITPSCPDECAPLFVTTLFPLIKSAPVHQVRTKPTDGGKWRYTQLPAAHGNIYKKFKNSPFVYSLKKGYFSKHQKVSVIALREFPLLLPALSRPQSLMRRGRFVCVS